MKKLRREEFAAALDALAAEKRAAFEAELSSTLAAFESNANAGRYDGEHGPAQLVDHLRLRDFAGDTMQLVADAVLAGELHEEGEP